MAYYPNKGAEGDEYNNADNIRALSCDLSSDCIREGHVFYVYHRFASVANSATVILTLNVVSPATNVMLFNNIFASTNGLINVVQKEGVTVSSAGTALTVFNRNRNSSNTTTVTASYGDTITGGTEITQYTIGSAGNPFSRSGGTVSKANPVMLKDGAIYAYEITNSSGTAQDILVKIEFRNGDYTV